MNEVIPALWYQIFEPGLIREMQLDAKWKSLLPGEIMIHAGQNVRMIPLVVRGTLKVSREDEKGKEILLYYVNANQSCALTFTCCMQVFPSEVSMVAEDDVLLAAIPIDKMDIWMGRYATWKAFVMTTIRNRFNELLRTIDQVVFQNLGERLITYLKEKSVATGSSLINLSHEQIAVEMATSREVISRLLKKLEQDKKLLLYRKQIKLLRDL